MVAIVLRIEKKLLEEIETLQEKTSKRLNLNISRNQFIASVLRKEVENDKNR